MKLGLSENEINQILENNGIAKGDMVSAENLRKAISKAIEENNKKIREDIRQVINEDTKKGLRKKGIVPPL
ncbi:hypothetical protein GOQ27_06995 [Clostridium sp. D2Q-11]|uniref:Uncharacterized protein n=1 Tax=Anaeromonas frigoriresistens TaxID=2683708 RepID=A0A942US82_9FIRM|nr:hypothetical protein [Anaeromonas frigoriresistens]MBS4538203.1 hypothetical protein [Anaeromonas frigoriresistens]